MLFHINYIIIFINPKHMPKSYWVSLNIKNLFNISFSIKCPPCFSRFGHNIKRP